MTGWRTSASPCHNIDCERADGSMGPLDLVVTKHQADAGGTAVYHDTISRPSGMLPAASRLAGFQFTTCVAASALSTAAMVRDRGIRVAGHRNPHRQPR